MGICKIDDCDSRTVGRGWCNKHYLRWKFHHDPLHVPEKFNHSDACNVENCNRPFYAKKLCASHYNSLLKGHNPYRRLPSISERFWTKVNQDGPEWTDRGPCWIWLAGTGCGGAGYFAITHDKSIKASRWTYEQLIGPINNFLVRNCDTPPCVNPWHWSDLTSEEKTRRSTDLITHCPQGHEYTERNTKIEYDGSRGCKTCASTRNHFRRTVVAEGDYIFVDDLGERDNWICALCSESVDPELSSRHPRMKSIDHIMPVSLGGLHIWENVQLAHFGCNSSKNNRI